MRPSKEGVTLAVWASPGAPRTALDGLADERVRVRLAAPAHENKANAELVRYIAKLFGVPRRQVSVTAGASSRRKTVAVSGIDVAEARRTLRL